MLRSGVNPLLVAAQMGHSTPETTYSRYAHVIAEAAPGIPITEAIERARAPCAACAPSEPPEAEPGGRNASSFQEL